MTRERSCPKIPKSRPCLSSARSRSSNRSSSGSKKEKCRSMLQATLPAPSRSTCPKFEGLTDLTKLPRIRQLLLKPVHLLPRILLQTIEALAEIENGVLIAAFRASQLFPAHRG